MKTKIVDLTLPEWTWIDGGEHEKGGDPLAGRSIIFHVRTASVVEILLNENFVPKGNVKSRRFNYRNNYGIVEKYIAVLHYSATCEDAEVIDDILQSAGDWYLHYLIWEDNNIHDEDIAALN